MPIDVDQWARRNGFTSYNAQRGSVVNYNNYAYNALNSYLRWHVHPNVERDEFAARLDRAIDQHRLKESTVVFRASKILAGFEGEIKSGQVFVDRGFTSTSLLRNVAEMHATTEQLERPRNVLVKRLFRIELPKGQRCLYTDPIVEDIREQRGMEQEVILPRGTQLVVTHVERIPIVGRDTDSAYHEIELVTAKPLRRRVLA